MLPPDQIYHELFFDLHDAKFLTDQKTIGDTIPERKPEDILADYRSQKTNPDFDLKEFFHRNFKIVEDPADDFESDTSQSVAHHIERLWPVLERPGAEFKAIDGYSLVPLSYPYIVPGGRFNEIYYWDSYFTMLGLQVSGKIDRIENMIRNFADLIDRIGHIPNGNRSYYLTRSQPPFFSLMVSLLAEEKGDSILREFLPQLHKEHKYWTKTIEHTPIQYPHAHLKTCHLGSDSVLNRYYDLGSTPRQEMHQYDLEDWKESDRIAEEFYRDVRSAAESGWDFSARWFKDPMDHKSNICTEILPVDLNCLLYYLESSISKSYSLVGENVKAEEFLKLSENRKEAIQRYFWSEEKGYFFDYHFPSAKSMEVISVAGLYPLFFNLSTKKQAERCAEFAKKHLLKDGGMVSTSINSGQQWDAPNGWAPLQWIAVRGLLNYGYDDLAKEIAVRWLSLNERVFKRSGQMMEKYNVVDLSLDAGGGEYKGQTGFGWSNGVYLKLHQMFG